MSLSWPLIGRQAEMSAIDTAISARDTSGIVVYGAAGVGKSRIVREALSAAEMRGSNCSSVVGTSSARAIPLGAFAAWAPADVTSTVQLLRDVIESLTSSASDAPVVAIDDVHLLDDLSIFVVHQIVLRRAAKVILTIREGDPIPDGVHEIAKVGRFDRVDLRPLSLQETATLLTAVLGGPTEPGAARRLWQLTEGNPLYLRTIVEREVAVGRLRRERTSWRWAGDPTMPPGLTELIETRILAAPESVVDVVDTLAVGEPISLETLSRIVGPSAVEEAENCGLIALESAAGRVEVRVIHPLYGEVRRMCAPTTKLRRLRGRVALELAASGDRNDLPVLVRRAALSLDSDLTPDADLLVRAAHGAVWLADLALAERIAGAAIRSGGGVEASFIRAHALSWLGRGREAEEVFARVPPGPLTDVERGRFSFLRASNLLWALGDPVHAQEVIDEASCGVGEHGGSFVDAFRTVYEFALDRPEEAMRTAADLALSDLPAVVGAETCWALTTIAADAGRVDEAEAVADAGYAAVARSFDAPQMRFNIADSHVGALLLAGRVGDAREMAERVRSQGADLPGAAQLLGLAVAGRAALWAGDLATAWSFLEQAVEGLSVSFAMGWGYRYRVPRTIVLAMRGSTDEAVAELSLLNDTRRPFRSLDYELSLARAWVSAGQGAVSEAIAVVSAAADRAHEKGHFAAEVLCVQTAVQFGCRSSGPRLRGLVKVVEGPRVGMAARFAEALRNGDPRELSLVSEHFEQMGDRVAAADAAAHAALANRRLELRGSALGCAARAADLAEQCGGVCTPVLRRVDDPLPLTDREREIVTLVGNGLSSREVAERLCLSVRTVESHVYRAMAKTGTRTRDELASLLVRGRRTAK